MNRYASITFSAIFVLINFLPCQVLAASITETKAEIGEGCDASGENSTAMGYNTTASGQGSTAMGMDTTASGSFSTAMGYRTTAIAPYSTAMGYNTTASGSFSIAMGCSTTANATHSLAGGRYMELTNTAERTFVWGHSQTAQSISTADAFLIFPAGRAGKVGIGTKSPIGKLHVEAGDGEGLRVISSNGNSHFPYHNGWSYISGMGIIFRSNGDNERMRLVSDGTLIIGGTSKLDSSPSYQLQVHDSLYIGGTGSALYWNDRTPYPKDLETAYAAVLSMERLPPEEYDENNKENQLDHSKLHGFIKSQDGMYRDLSATVSAQNEVIKDLLKRIEELEAKVK